MTAAQNEKTYGLFSSSANKKLIGKLNESAAKVFLFPLLETEKIVLDKSEIDYLYRLSTFDWIIFTDIFATDYFLQNLSENEIDFFEMDAVKVCACGEAVSDRLRFSQIHADIVPALIDAENIIETLINYVCGNELKNLKFLIIKEVSQGFNIKETLEAVNVTVCQIDIYKIKKTVDIEVVKLKTLLKSGAIDEFIFSDAQDFFALKFYLADEHPSDIFSDIKISTTGENAFQTAKEFGLRPLYFQPHN